jgi:hypothetical protein
MMGSRQKAIASLLLLTLVVTAACATGANGGIAIPSGSVAPARTLDPSRIETGPASATIGVAYPFDLYVHCGGQYAVFGGEHWQTDTPPRGDPPTNAGSSIYYDYVPGWMIRTGNDMAVFYPAGTSDIVHFVRIGDFFPLCA